ncbi:MAG: ribosome maturation factor RimP [Clostridia bacterium]|nr:ribosome maturation factor RimP [Clostridia bacterium]
MAKKSVTEIIEDLVADFIASQGMELVDVEFVKEGQHRYLRIFIDKEDDKISLDDCKLVSDYLNDKIDQLDPIKENYFLEISSPGIERPLKKPADYDKNVGNMVQAKLYTPIDGRKIVEGTLLGLNNNIVSIDMGNEKVDLPIDKISLIKPIIQL